MNDIIEATENISDNPDNPIEPILMGVLVYLVSQAGGDVTVSKDQWDTAIGGTLQVRVSQDEVRLITTSGEVYVN